MNVLPKIPRADAIAIKASGLISGICRMMAPAIVDVAAPKIVLPIVKRQVSFSSETSSLAKPIHAPITISKSKFFSCSCTMPPNFLAIKKAPEGAKNELLRLALSSQPHKLTVLLCAHVHEHLQCVLVMLDKVAVVARLLS